MTQHGQSRAAREIDRLLTLYPRGFDLSLDRIRRLLDDLGRPQDRLPPVIHIAGTNGKGSATAFARAMLEEGGHVCHVHTSAASGQLARALPDRHARRWPVLSAMTHSPRRCSGRRLPMPASRSRCSSFSRPSPSFLFADHPADAAIIEVGLGGRFDATNVLERPAVSLIMPIALDHQAWLGDTVEQIALEKGGIIKPHCPW